MISNNNRPISAGIRLAAMLLDHVLMTLIAMVFFLPALITAFSATFKTSHEHTGLNVMAGPTVYSTLFGFALYLCKDIVNGRSFAKRILKLQVVDNRTGEVATPLQSFIRNLFCVLWMFEAIVALTNISRRLGDRVAGTKLVAYNATLEQPKPSVGKLAIPLMISYTMLLLLQLLPSAAMAKMTYSETSYNEAESKKLEQLIEDSLGAYLTPDIRVYDTVNNQNIKYVSTILKLKENYIADDDSYQQLHEMTTNLIYSKLPKNAFTGQIKYVYRSDGYFNSRITTIGRHVLAGSKK